MNKIIITGRLTRDPELKVSERGSEFCKFTVAVDRTMKDRNGQKVADFIDCTAFGKTAALIQKYFPKGKGITVEGRMESNRWVDNDGQNRTSWGITTERVEFQLGSGRDKPFDAPDPAVSEFKEIKESESDGELPF
ncbi:MAG: single-stranded DNA-binding protein [Firmicutes bacterium]|nr:single-stranded DNA-binding protein [Bacillota bacterium]